MKRSKRGSIYGKVRYSHKGAYDYMAIIGKGAFGQVVRVRSRDSGRHFAMKILVCFLFGLLC